MSKILYIKSDLKKDNESRSFIVANHFIDAYKIKHPKDEIITLDLYKENIDFLRMEDLVSIRSIKTEESKNDFSLKYAYQFIQADKYIFASPMWNLGIPAILKAYFDLVCVNGISFAYTENGSVGLLKNKKAIFFNSRGGIYENATYENSGKYVKDILNFLGIELSIVPIQGVDIAGADIQKIIEEAKAKSMELLKIF